MAKASAAAAMGADDGGGDDTADPSADSTPANAGTVFELLDKGDGTFVVSMESAQDDATEEDGGGPEDESEDNGQTYNSLAEAVAALFKLAKANPASGTAPATPDDQMMAGYSGASGTPATPTSGP